MSILESTRKMTTNEKMCYDMGYAQGKQDAVPVVRGEWTYEINEYFRTCSVCRISQALLAGENLSRFKYCPFCGAKMESEGST